MDNTVKELFEDPAGYIPESELKQLSEITDPAGGTGTTWGCATLAAAVIVSVNLCPTTVCSRHC